MFLNKKMILSAALLALPMMASANLIVSNNTNQPSTLIITSGGSFNGKCSSTYNRVTAPGQSQNLPWGAVGILCSNISPCIAQLYMTANCTGPVYGVASLGLAAGHSTTISQQPAGSPYNITATNSGQDVLVNLNATKRSAS